MKYVLSICVSICILMLGCGGTTSGVVKNNSGDVYRTNCITESTKDLLIRWGVYYDSTGTLYGYEIDANARLWRYVASTKKSNYERDSIGTVSASQLCFFKDTVRNTFIKIQSLFVPAKTRHFIEYQNPANQVSLRAMWDARYQTYGSKEFRSIFDSLNTIGKVAN
ncbi:MAG: hypothetical protein JNJ85_15175 [Candidatus Kapabacteria bacterium]|nr:hypothetical protein [Candidatus Kapabacteria bacterium]MBX7154868.1 hypothetical protein [Bacteroidota bacterium]